MNARQLAASTFLAAAVASVAWSGIAWQRHGRVLAETRAETLQAKAKLDSTRNDLHETGLRYRGFQQTRMAVPDSIRRFAGGVIIEQDNTYRKKLTSLEQAEQKQKSRVEKLEAQATEATRRRWTTALPGVAAALLLAGLARLVSVRPVTP